MADAGPVIRIHPADDVVIARQQMLGGTPIASEGITVSGLIPPGHKIAVRAIAAGQPVRRYNQIIGTATRDIAAGQHVHSHNLAFSHFDTVASVTDSPSVGTLISTAICCVSPADRPKGQAPVCSRPAQPASASSTSCFCSRSCWLCEPVAGEADGLRPA